jgi:hypothetical protein
MVSTDDVAARMAVSLSVNSSGLAAYPVKRNDCAANQSGESLHDQIIFVLDLIQDGSIPIGRTKQIEWRHVHGL